VKFDNLKIGSKVMAPVIALMIVMVGGSLMAVTQIFTLQKHMSEITENAAPADLALARFDRRLNAIGYGAYRTLVYNGTSPQAHAAREEVENNFKEAATQLDLIVKAEPSLKPQVDAFHKKLKSVQETVMQGVDFAQSDADEMAAVVLSTADPEITALSKDVTTLTEKHGQQTEALVAKAKKSAIQGVLLTMGVGGAAGFAAFLFALWVGRRKIGAPLNALQSTMQALARGDLSASVDGVDRKDEIGGMAKAVQVFKDNAQALKTAEAEQARLSQTTEAERLQNERAREAAAQEQAIVMQSVAGGLSALAAGDLTYRINEAFPDSYIRLRDDFNGAVSELEKVVASIAGATRAIGSGAQEIASAADDMSRRTEQQAASLEETAAALDEITATVQRSAEGAIRANQVVGGARTDAEHSGAVMQQASGAMEAIEASSRQINQIIGVIDEIAFQTNLLALNAGVEAARAGEAGRGFAVVASEVRALAQRSAEAAKEIKGLISASSEQINQGVDLVGRTGEALHRIVTQVSEIDALVSEIAASSREQSTGLREVNSAVNQMDQVVQQNAAMVEQSTAASHALRSESAKLVELVARFRVGGAVQSPAPARAPRNPVATARAKVAAAFGGAPAPAAAPADDGWEEF